MIMPYNKKRKFDIKKRYISDIWNIYDFTTVELPGGYWCPECLKEEWTYGKQAKYNPFLGQVWWPIHPETDDYTIKMEYSGYDIYHELREKLGFE